VTPSLQNVVLRLKLKPEELKLLKQAVADWKWSAFDAHQRMAARCKMNDGREPTKETMDMAWNAYKMAEDIGDRIADATSPQNPSHQGTGHLVDRTLQGVVQIRDSEK
jgi:hypothetical protein